MPLYKQWGVTHYTFDVIVLTSSKKSFLRLHHKIFLNTYQKKIHIASPSIKFTCKANMKKKSTFDQNSYKDANIYELQQNWF